MVGANLNGVWKDKQGGSITLTQSGDTIVGKVVGGGTHSALRGTYNGHWCGTHYDGPYQNEEGNVRGKGTSTLKICGPNEIEFAGYGEWRDLNGNVLGQQFGTIIFRRA